MMIQQEKEKTMDHTFQIENFFWEFLATFDEF